MQVLGSVLGFQGMNTDMIEERLPPEDEPIFITNGENMLIKNGKIEKLRGTNYLNNISSQLGEENYRTILGLPIFRPASTTKKLLAVTPRDLRYLKDDSEWYKLGSLALGGNDSLLTYAEIMDKFIFTLSDSGRIYSYDGTTFGPLFTSPDDLGRQAKAVLGFKGFLFLLRTIEGGAEKLTDGGLEVWTTATNLTNWTEALYGTSTVNREDTEKHGGDHSCRFDVDASNSTVSIAQAETLVAGAKYRVSLWYKNSVAGKQGALRIYDNTSTVYLKEDGTWNTGAYNIVLPSSTTWKLFSMEFSAHSSYTNYIFMLVRYSAASSSIYFDDASLEEVGTEYPRRLRWSNAFVPETFDAEDLTDLDAKGVILNAKQLENEVIVYFDKSVHRVAFKSLDEEQGFFGTPIAGADGLLAAKTLCGDDDAHFYLASKGLMRHVTGDLPRSISDKKFNKLVLDQIDPVYYYRAVAQYYPHLNLLFLAYPKSGSTYNDTQIIYDTSVQEVVSKKTLAGENYSAYGTFEKDLSGLTPDERKAYGLSFIPIFGNKDGYVKEQKINAYQDGTSTYKTSITLPGTFFKSRDLNKRCLAFDLLIEKLTDEDITFTLALANEIKEIYGFTYTITGPGSTGIKRYQVKSDDNGVGVDCFGKEFKVEIADSDCAYGWKFHGAIFYGDYLGQR